MNQQDYKNKQPAVEEEPLKYPQDYQEWLDSLPPMSEEDEKALEEWVKSIPF